MLRRTLIAMFGAAPVAAVMPDSAVADVVAKSSSVTPPVLTAARDFATPADRFSDPVRYAKANLIVQRKLIETGVGWDDWLDAETLRIDGMRSWSPAVKSIIRSRARKIERIRQAERQVRNAIAQSALPKWMRPWF